MSVSDCRTIEFDIKSERGLPHVFYHCFFGEIVPFFALLEQLPPCDLVVPPRNSCVDLYDPTFWPSVVNRSLGRIGPGNASETYSSTGIDNLLTSCQPRLRHPVLPKMHLTARHGLAHLFSDARKHMRQLCECPVVRHKSIIVIQRHTRTTRQITPINMSAIARYVNASIIDFANHSLCHQICVASSAHVIVGQHGSGLSFSAIAHNVVEIGGDNQHTMYKCITNLLGYAHTALPDSDPHAVAAAILNIPPSQARFPFA